MINFTSMDCQPLRYRSARCRLLNICYCTGKAASLVCVKRLRQILHLRSRLRLQVTLCLSNAGIIIRRIRHLLHNLKQVCTGQLRNLFGSLFVFPSEIYFFVPPK